MNEVPPVQPALPSEQPEEAAEPAARGETKPKRQRRKKRHSPDWWRARNVLGVLNWELVLIAVVAVVAGVAATIGSSIVGVR